MPAKARSAARPATGTSGSSALPPRRNLARARDAPAGRSRPMRTPTRASDTDLPRRHAAAQRGERRLVSPHPRLRAPRGRLERHHLRLGRGEPRRHAQAHVSPARMHRRSGNRGAGRSTPGEVARRQSLGTRGTDVRTGHCIAHPATRSYIRVQHLSRATEDTAWHHHEKSSSTTHRLRPLRRPSQVASRHWASSGDASPPQPPPIFRTTPWPHACATLAQPLSPSIRSPRASQVRCRRMPRASPPAGRRVLTRRSPYTPDGIPSLGTSAVMDVDASCASHATIGSRPLEILRFQLYEMM